MVTIQYSCEYLVLPTQAVAAIRNYPRPISSGASISKGKNKVDGIGAKCGELIDEFLSTGSISKIAEKKGLIS